MTELKKSGFGIRKGCGDSRSTQFYNKRKRKELLESADGCKRMREYFPTVNNRNIDGYNTEDDMQQANGACHFQVENSKGTIQNEKSRMLECIQKLMENEAKISRNKLVEKKKRFTGLRCSTSYSNYEIFPTSFGRRN